MHNFGAGKLLTHITGIATLTTMAPHGHNVVIPEENYEALKTHARFLVEELTKLELTASLASARRLQAILLNEARLRSRKDLDERAYESDMWAVFEPMPFQRMKTDVKDLLTRFRDEMEERTVVALSVSGAQLLKADKPLFGEEVATAFPSAADDIAEAGACLAFERGTACVMHLMRVGEVGLSALANSVGVGKQNDWGAYIREITKKLDAQAKAAGARSTDEQFCAEVVASFDNMKRAWRNPTMHADRTYPVPRAEEIFSAVRSFMRYLATKISE